MKKTITITLLLFMLFLAACGPSQPAEPSPTPVDVGAIQTQAVQTVVAGVTQTALAMPPTPTDTPVPPTITPIPTPEATATATVNICDASAFISDANVPDGTQIAAGQAFVKTWKVKNIGSCTWTRTYTIRYGYGDRIGGQDTYLSTEVLANQEAEISLELVAPKAPGTYRSYWRLFNNNSYAFGEYFSVIIVVP